MLANPLNELQLPVSPSALADWLRLDDADDPLLMPCLYAATQAVIGYLQRDLLIRQWRVTYSDEMLFRRDLSRPIYVHNSIVMPYTQLVSVQSVVAYGVTLTADDYRVIVGNPASIQTNNPLSYYYVEGEQALVINYTAGFEIVPEQIKVAVLMVAAYVYSMRGACAGVDAVTQSGAAAMLTPWRAMAGVVI